MSFIAPNLSGRVICKTFSLILGVNYMNCKKHEHGFDNQSINRRIVLVGSATFLSFLLLFNTHFFNSAAVAQRLNSRTNETQDLGINSTNLPAGASQVSTKLRVVGR